MKFKGGNKGAKQSFCSFTLRFIKLRKIHKTSYETELKNEILELPEMIAVGSLCALCVHVVGALVGEVDFVMTNKICE